MLARQVPQPTERQDVTDPLWDDYEIIWGQSSEDAKTTPLANYDDVPWPTVQIDDATYCFDQWTKMNMRGRILNYRETLSCFFAQFHAIRPGTNRRLKILPGCAVLHNGGILLTPIYRDLSTFGTTRAVILTEAPWPTSWVRAVRSSRKTLRSDTVKPNNKFS